MVFTLVGMVFILKILLLSNYSMNSPLRFISILEITYSDGSRGGVSDISALYSIYIIELANA